MKTCIEKQEELIERFQTLTNQEDKYHEIISIGRENPPAPSIHFTDKELIKGCQSRLFLHTTYKNGNLLITTKSDALISQGLAILLTYSYDKEHPEKVFQHPPYFIKQIGLDLILSPARFGGVTSLYHSLCKHAQSFLQVSKQ